MACWPVWAVHALLALGLALGIASPLAAQARQPTVLAAAVEGVITPVMANHVDAALDRAESAGHVAAVLTVDTPGGLDSSMRKIVQRILAARVPVVVYVSPQGARAASAGAIITLSAHVVAMAPGTAIGASTPVDLEGGDVERKVVNDAAAFAESLARLRDRNVQFAVDTVREGRSASAVEAVEIGAVDLLSPSLPELLGTIDGRELIVADEPVVLRTAEAAVEEFEMSLLRRIQQVLADPNLAFLFMSLGTLGIMYEIASPGIGVGGILGAILVLLGLFSVSVLPVNAVGLLLLALAAGLFLAELFAPGVGVAAAGGTIALVLSGVFLFRDTPGFGVSLAVVTPVAVVVGGAVVLAGRLAVRSRGSVSTTTGPGLFTDRLVTVRHSEGTRGQTFVEGAWWNLRSSGRELVEGDEVRVVGVEGLDLVVEPPAHPPTDHQTTGEP
ncbi:MAG TPA: nodulation protein NfeD [Actinomycetota bacterium]|nr:nodulation protein NfeD [Actinomycetota bacterium]